MLCWQRAGTCHHLIPHRLGPDGVLGSQRGAAEQDEEQDEVGEPGGVDNAMTQDTDPVGQRRGGRRAVSSRAPGPLQHLSGRKTLEPSLLDQQRRRACM